MNDKEIDQDVDQEVIRTAVTHVSKNHRDPSVRLAAFRQLEKLARERAEAQEKVNEELGVPD